MSEQPTDDPFDNCELGPDAILGTQTFENVLFIEESETPVNGLTGEMSVDEVRAFAEGVDSDTPHIA